MSTLREQFDKAVMESRELPSKPDAMTLLRMYSLFKQGTVGNNPDEKPGFTDIVARAKWDAWDKLRGKASEQAMQDYVDLVKELQESLS